MREPGRRLALAEALVIVLAAVPPMVGIALFAVSAVPLPVEAAVMPVRDLGRGATSVSVGGFDLWYREVGHQSANPPVVVIHGGPGMSDHYFNRALDFLAKDYRVIYYDQRGSGFSQIKRAPRFYRFSYLVDDLEALRRTRIHADKLILVAHSFGGLVAMNYAVDHPDHVAKLILISSMPPRDWGSRLDPSSAPLDPRFMAMNPVERDREFLGSYLNSIDATLYDPDSGIVPDIGYLSYVPSTLFWTTSVGYNFIPGLSRLSLPALVIYGANDTFLPSVPWSLHLALKDSELVRMERSGHWSFLEEPDRFKAVVGSFLGVR